MLQSDKHPADSDSTQKSSSPVRRRAVLSSIGTAGAMVLAGCSGGNNGQSGDQPLHLITDVPSDPPSLDPFAIEPTAFSAWGVWSMNAYEPLVYYESESSTLEPVLATKVPSADNGLITNDGKTFEFPLREGVTFHTGGEMTAQDVQFSIERNQTMGLSPGAGNLDVISEIEAPDDYTIRLTTEGPMPEFLNGIVPSKDMVVMSQEAIENNGGVAEGQRNRYVAQNTVGTGPYQLAQWNRGSNLRYDYFEDYWAPDTVGPEGIFQRVHTEVSTAVAVMTRGEAHASSYELGDIESFEGTGAETTFFSSLEQLFLFFNFEIPYDRDDMPDDDTVPPDFLQDPNVRRAFGFAIDYQDYYDQVWAGHGSRSNQPCHLEPMRFFDPDALTFEYDPDMVEELLRAAGYWEEGFTFTIMSENFGEAANTLLYIKDSIENINDRITINTVTMPEAQYVERRNKDPWSFTVDAGGFPSFGPDPAGYYAQLLEGPPAEGGKHAKYIDQRFFEAANEAASTLDTDRRQELYSELQQLGFEDPPALSLLAEELVKIHLPCVDPEINPVASKDVAKRWKIADCEPITF